MASLPDIRMRLISWVENNEQAKRSATTILAELEAEVRRQERRAVLEEAASPSGATVSPK